MNICFMFGHRDVSESILPQIERAVESHYLQLGVREFVVGNRGRFDALAARAVRTMKKRYADIVLTLLLAYYPTTGSKEHLAEYDSTLYPDGIERVPKRYAVISANRYMIERADSIICFVNHVGNTVALLDAARQRNRKRNLPIENLAEE
jgi:hypothetical protein